MQFILNIILLLLNILIQFSAVSVKFSQTEIIVSFLNNK